jgi:hypothetical protein
MTKKVVAPRLSEAEVKLALGQWLTGLGFEVFDERPNPRGANWSTFEVLHTNRSKHPDLVVRGDLLGGRTHHPGAYVAIEIKRGYKHHDILDGFDAVLDYFTDYIWGAEYAVQQRRIGISAFAFATHFSRQGFLWEAEGKFEPHGIVKGPFDAYPTTFTLARLLWRQRDNLLRRFQQLSGLPKIERRLRPGLNPLRETPETGILVRKPGVEGPVILMVPPAPYHWRFEPTT